MATESRHNGGFAQINPRFGSILLSLPGITHVMHSNEAGTKANKPLIFTKDIRNLGLGYYFARRLEILDYDVLTSVFMCVISLLGKVVICSFVAK